MATFTWVAPVHGHYSYRVLTSTRITLIWYTHTHTHTHTRGRAPFHLAVSSFKALAILRVISQKFSFLKFSAISYRVENAALTSSSCQINLNKKESFLIGTFVGMLRRPFSLQTQARIPYSFLYLYSLIFFIAF